MNTALEIITAAAIVIALAALVVAFLALEETQELRTAAPAAPSDETAAPELEAPTGATFGPWATHAPRCGCSACR